jgi:hypothetical protein
MRRSFGQSLGPCGKGGAMNDVLLTAGVASIILAVVGGGAKAFGVEVPVLDKRSRQIGLGIVGVLFLVGAYLAGSGDGGDDGPEVAAYRQEVLATCRSLQDAASGNPVVAAANDDGTYDRARFISALRGQLRASIEVLKEFWKRPVPQELKADATAARNAADALSARTRTQINQTPSIVPPVFSVQQLAGLIGELNTGLRAPSSRFEGAMSRLAGQPCRVLAQPGT